MYNIQALAEEEEGVYALLGGLYSQQNELRGKLRRGLMDWRMGLGHTRELRSRIREAEHAQAVLGDTLELYRRFGAAGLRLLQLTAKNK